MTVRSTPISSAHACSAEDCVRSWRCTPIELMVQSLSYMQCAAVSTHVVEISEPPQM